MLSPASNPVGGVRPVENLSCFAGETDLDFLVFLGGLEGFLCRNANILVRRSLPGIKRRDNSNPDQYSSECAAL
jgi:hypothetical protein